MTEPERAEFSYNLGSLYQVLGRAEEAEQLLSRAITQNPQFSPAWLNLGMLYFSQGALDKARSHLSRLVALGTADAMAFNNLLLVLDRQGDLSEAHRIASRVLAKGETLALALPAAISVFARTCDFGNRDAALRRWFEYADRDMAEGFVIASGLLDSHYSSALSAQELFRLHQRWAELAEKGTKPLEPRQAPERVGQNRKIRIGYVSGDFWDHATAYFVLPIVMHHDKSQYDVYCYHTNRREDEVTALFRHYASQFRHVPDVKDVELARQVRDDDIDILVDLAGYTSSNHLRTFACKPAPVQITYLGYPDTTGLTKMDYVIVDTMIAAGQGTHYTERQLVLPECVVTFPEIPVKPVAGHPCVKNGYVTFGSLNNLKKITVDAVQAWAKILQQVDRAVMVIAYADAEADITQTNIRNEFAKYGVNGERVKFEGGRERLRFLELYNDIDIHLDTFPYSGTTTTCEALWMGVPTVTLVGDPHCQRVSASILKNVGLERLVASNESEYVGISVRLATNIDELVRLRSAILDKVSNSILARPERFVTQLERLYRQVLYPTDPNGSSSVAAFSSSPG